MRVAVGVGGVDDEVLLALAADGRLGKIEQRDPRSGRVGGDRLVPKVEAEPPRFGPADDPRQEDRGRDERQVGIAGRIPDVEQRAGSRRSLDTRFVEPGMDGKGRRASHHQPGDRQPALPDPLAELQGPLDARPR